MQPVHVTGYLLLRGAGISHRDQCAVLLIHNMSLLIDSIVLEAKYITEL